jgi:hypothetical protein
MAKDLRIGFKVPRKRVRQAEAHHHALALNFNPKPLSA